MYRYSWRGPSREVVKFRLYFINTVNKGLSSIWLFQLHSLKITSLFNTGEEALLRKVEHNTDITTCIFSFILIMYSVHCFLSWRISFRVYLWSSQNFSSSIGKKPFEEQEPGTFITKVFTYLSIFLISSFRSIKCKFAQILTSFFLLSWRSIKT